MLPWLWRLHSVWDPNYLLDFVRTDVLRSRPLRRGLTVPDPPPRLSPTRWGCSRLSYPHSPCPTVVPPPFSLSPPPLLASPRALPGLPGACGGTPSVHRLPQRAFQNAALISAPLSALPSPVASPHYLQETPKFVQLLNPRPSGPRCPPLTQASLLFPLEPVHLPSPPLCALLQKLPWRPLSLPGLGPDVTPWESLPDRRSQRPSPPPHAPTRLLFTPFPPYRCKALISPGHCTLLMKHRNNSTFLQ